MEVGLRLTRGRSKNTGDGACLGAKRAGPEWPGCLIFEPVSNGAQAIGGVTSLA